MRKTQVIAGTLAGSVMLGLLAVSATSALAQSTLAVREDQAQLRTDEAALAREKAQLRANESTLRQDTMHGKMAAESPDAERVYRDRLALQDEKKDIAADSQGSRQMQVDDAAWRREGAQLRTDERTLRQDEMSGRMAAESRDSFNVYQDNRAIKGQEQAIAADRAILKADENA